jgi:hypothetical protein
MMLDFEERVTQGLRPERPQGDKKSTIPDEIWSLAERCWVYAPSERPTANIVRDEVNCILQLAPVEQRKTSPGDLRDEIRILRQDIAGLREKGEAKEQELERLRGDLEEMNVKRTQTAQEARRQGELKVRELLRLRAELSLITHAHNRCTQSAQEARLQGEAKDQEMQQLREELSSMKKRLEEASEAMHQEQQKSKDLVSSVAEVLHKLVQEAQAARRQAEAKDLELQDLFLSFAKKHSRGVQEVKPEGERRPADTDAVLDQQSKLDSANKSPLIPHHEGYDSATTKPIEPSPRNIHDDMNPSLPLPHPAEASYNPWKDNKRHGGPREREPQYQLVDAKATPEPRSLPGQVVFQGRDGDDEVRRHQGIENIKTSDEPAAGPRYVQNLLGGKYPPVSRASKCSILNLIAQQDIREDTNRRDWVMWGQPQLLRMQSST